MPERLDQENWNTLQEHGEFVDWGYTIVKLHLVEGGKLVGWEEIETKRGHRAPLKKVNEGVVD